MKIMELLQNSDIEKNVDRKDIYFQFEKLLIELRKRELPDGIVISINKDIEELNSTSVSGRELRKKIAKTQNRILNLLEKEVKLVTKNYYQKIWLALGIAAFGVPLGVVLGTSLGNMAFLGIGLPIGLAIGIALGSGMDKKALKEGRQLDIEIKY